MEDRHPFAVHFREDNPHAKERIGVYEQALALAAAIDGLVEGSHARVHLRDALDKSSTLVALRIAQAAGEIGKAERRRQYTYARRAATDCAALLDIMARRAGSDPAALAKARAIVTDLVGRLAQLAAR